MMLRIRESVLMVANSPPPNMTTTCPVINSSYPHWIHLKVSMMPIITPLFRKTTKILQTNMHSTRLPNDAWKRFDTKNYTLQQRYKVTQKSVSRWESHQIFGTCKFTFPSVFILHQRDGGGLIIPSLISISNCMPTYPH